MNTLTTHTAVIVQERRVRRYIMQKHPRRDILPKVASITTHLDYVELWEGPLDAPTMREGDNFFIVELGTSVQVKRVERTSDNKYRYFTREIDFITDEYTEVSRQEAQEQLDDYTERLRAFREERKGKVVLVVKEPQPWYVRLRDWFGTWS